MEKMERWSGPTIIIEENDEQLRPIIATQTTFWLAMKFPGVNQRSRVIKEVHILMWFVGKLLKSVSQGNLQNAPLV